MNNTRNKFNVRCGAGRNIYQRPVIPERRVRCPSGVNRQNRFPLKVAPNFRVDAAPPLRGLIMGFGASPKTLF